MIPYRVAAALACMSNAAFFDWFIGIFSFFVALAAGWLIPGQMLSTSYQVIDKNVYQGNNDKKCGLFLSKLNCDVLVGMPAPAAASVCSTRFRQAIRSGDADISSPPRNSYIIYRHEGGKK